MARTRMPMLPDHRIPPNVWHDVMYPIAEESWAAQSTRARTLMLMNGILFMWTGTEPLPDRRRCTQRAMILAPHNDVLSVFACEEAVMNQNERLRPRAFG